MDHPTDKLFFQLLSYLISLLNFNNFGHSLFIKENKYLSDVSIIPLLILILNLQLSLPCGLHSLVSNA